MEDIILEEVRRNVLEKPKPTIDIDYLYSIKRQVQDFADQTNARLKKNVYQNYSLFIESSREISTLKEEMKQLNGLLEQQQSSMNRLLDQLNKTPIIQQPTLEKPKIDPFRLELNDNDNSEVEAEMLPSWLIKSPEDFDVLIAQRNLREAVDLAQRVKNHFDQYPKCCENNNNHIDLKAKIDARLLELVNVICSELQPATDRIVQGGPRSSISSVQLLRELNLSSRAVKLYLDQRSSVLRFVLGQQKIESTTTLQFLKQICSIFFHSLIETCNEFKQAFELDQFINKAVEEGVEQSGIDISRQEVDQLLLFDLVSPIYNSPHPTIDDGSPTSGFNGNDISSHILNHHANKVGNNSQIKTGSQRNIFYFLSTYSSLTYWIIQEFENFISLFRKNVFNNSQLTISLISESIYHLRTQCSKVAIYCELDTCKFVESKLESDVHQIIDESERKLIETIKKLDSEEQWQPMQFHNKAQVTRFLEEMNDVDLRTMPTYMTDLKLPFTNCKTSFARYFLITVRDLAKLVNSTNRDHIDNVLVEAFKLEMESIVETIKKTKVNSKIRLIMNNSNFLLTKVINVADEQYSSTTGSSCQKLLKLGADYKEKVKAITNL